MLPEITLCLSDCNQLTDEGLRKVLLSSGGLIELLNASGTNITGQFSDGLDDTKLKKLKDLNLLQMSLARTAITREFAAAEEVRNKMKKIVDLDLSYCINLTEEFAKQMKTFSFVVQLLKFDRWDSLDDIIYIYVRKQQR